MKSFCKIIAISSILTLFLFGIFGFGMGMNAYQTGMAEDCPFLMGESSLCPMTAVNHIDAWQNMFLATVLPLVFFGLFLFVVFVFHVDVQFSPLLQRFLFYFQKQHRNFLFWTPLFESLRSGIIQPKLFA